MTDFAIPIRLDSFLNYYPLVTKTPVTTKVGSKTIVNKTLVKLKDPGGSLDKELDGWATENFNQNASYTTCCIQMSHAINMVFHTADTTKMVGLRTYAARPTPPGSSRLPTWSSATSLPSMR